MNDASDRKATAPGHVPGDVDDAGGLPPLEQGQNCSRPIHVVNGEAASGDPATMRIVQEHSDHFYYDWHLMYGGRIEEFPSLEAARTWCKQRGFSYVCIDHLGREFDRSQG